MTILRNIVGLARFLFFLFTPPRRVRAKKLSYKEALLEKHIGPTVSLTDKEPFYCSKCHTMMGWKAKENGDAVLVDNRGNIIRISGVKIIGKNGEQSAFAMNCPNGHQEVIRWKG